VNDGLVQVDVVPNQGALGAVECDGEDEDGLGELADLVGFHVGQRVAPLAAPCPELLSQLFAAGGWAGREGGQRWPPSSAV
jgi:hypothetical protein